MFIGAGVKRGYHRRSSYHLEAFLRISLEGLGVTESLPGVSACAPDMNELFEPVRAPATHREIVLYTQTAAKAPANYFRNDLHR